MHGAWHDPSCWDLLAAELRNGGHEVFAPELPLHDAAAGFRERARPAVEALANAAGPAVVVGHSMSSAYAPIVANEREDVLLVHLCPSRSPFAAPPSAPTKFRPTLEFPPSRPDGTTVWDPEVAIATIYARLPDDMARKLADRLRPMAPPPDDFPLPGHPEVPTALIYASEDEFFEPEWERFMARESLDVDPIEIRGGHFPMAEDPAGLSALLSSLA